MSRMCWCLPRPIEEEEKLQRLEEQPLDQMKPEFVQGIRALREEVLRRAGPFVQSGGRRNASREYKSLLYLGTDLLISMRRRGDVGK